MTLGAVALEHGDYKSLVPRGFQCETTPKHGPGLPYRTDAPPELREALTQWQKTGDIAPVIERATAFDGLTLWHLLQRAQGEERKQVLDAMKTLTPAEWRPEVSDEAALKLEPEALKAWLRLYAEQLLDVLPDP